MDGEETHANSKENQQPDNYLLSRDRVRRQIRPPPRFANTNFTSFALNVLDLLELEEPTNYNEAVRSKDWSKWKKVVEEKLESLDKNNTRTLVDRAKGKKVIGCKWVFKRKQGIPGVEATRYKARLVEKGFSQVKGIDYHEVFSPVVKHASIIILLAITAIHDLELKQLDVKTVFLYGNLEERILMTQPEGFVKEGKEGKVCLLQKSLYGLKQSHRQ